LEPDLEKAIYLRIREKTRDIWIKIVDYPATDQRGFPRPDDGDHDGVAICDMGSVEAQVQEKAILLIPKSHNFGVVAIGCLTVNQFTVGNFSNQYHEIAAVQVAGTNAADFYTQNDTCTGVVLKPSEKCNFEVVFKPESLDSKEAKVPIF
jgi:hypothetical protein